MYKSYEEWLKRRLTRADEIISGLVTTAKQQYNR
jgi:hypothetical protein